MIFTIVKIIAIRYNDRCINFKLTDRITKYEWNTGIKLSTLNSIMETESEIIYDEFIVIDENLHQQRILNFKE